MDKTEDSEKVSKRSAYNVLVDSVNKKNMANIYLSKNSFRVLFLGVVDRESVLFDVPVNVTENIFNHQKDEPLNVKWFREKDGYHYYFESHLLEITQNLKDGLPAISIAYPDFLYRIQRRKSFRMQVPLNDATHVTIHFGVPPEKIDQPAFAHDLSATGGRFSFSTQIDDTRNLVVNQIISVTIHLDGKPQEAECRIVRIDKTGTPKDHDSKTERWMIGVHFVNQSIDFRQRLEQYVIRQQWRK